MARSCFKHIVVSGISTVVPAQEIRLEDELKYFDGNTNKAKRVTRIVGIDKRRIAPRGVTASDLCQQAAELLFTGMKLDLASIDALIFVSQSPDHVVPATACILQHKLGLPKTCAAFDVNQGCAGFVYGLWLSASLLESRACTRILLLVGEASARLFDTDNRIVTPVFGDCGTATLVEYCKSSSPTWFELGTDGSGAEMLLLPVSLFGRLPLPDSGEEYEKFCRIIHDQHGTPWRLIRPYMDGGAIFDFTLSVVPEHLQSLLEYADKRVTDIDWLILHQSNKQMIQAIAEKSGFHPAQVPWNTFSTYGNQAGASIPSAICHMLANELSADGISKTLILSGYGVGLSWASAVLNMGPIWCSGVNDYVVPSDYRTPEQVYAAYVEKITGRQPL